MLRWCLSTKLELSQMLIKSALLVGEEVKAVIELIADYYNC